MILCLFIYAYLYIIDAQHRQQNGLNVEYCQCVEVLFRSLCYLKLC